LLTDLSYMVGSQRKLGSKLARLKLRLTGYDMNFISGPLNENSKLTVDEAKSSKLRIYEITD